MFRRRFTVFVLSMLAAVGSVAALPQAGLDADRTIYGAGTNSCDAWLDAREHDTWFTAGQWILGFVSAANQYSRVAPAKTDSRALASWVDDYCREHPESDLADAGRQLVDRLVSGPFP